MNRIILVGNGFDLAHGLKTSYCDFIEDYLNEVFKELVKNEYSYEDPLISIRINHFTKKYDFPIELFSSYTEFFYEFKRRYSRDFNISINTMLKSTLASISNCNWVDLEMAFFKTLCEGVKIGGLNTIHVRNTNQALDFIKGKLEEYLSKRIEVDISKLTVNPNILSILTQAPKIADFTAAEKPGDNINLRSQNSGNSHYFGIIEETMIVNFNYTSTLKRYYDQIPNSQKAKYSLNFIHGKLGDDQNPPIFGFGDEHDKKYLEFEDHNENSLFEHVKSFRYLETGNYKNLIRFADSGKFQVFIVGHSCGLTDRTLLKSIFENQNCRSIKIFHYRRSDGSTDYHEKTIEMGRHFTDKGFMRRVIVDFDRNDFLPQYHI